MVLRLDILPNRYDDRPADISLYVVTAILKYNFNNSCMVIVMAFFINVYNDILLLNHKEHIHINRL